MVPHERNPAYSRPPVASALGRSGATTAHLRLPFGVPHALFGVARVLFGVPHMRFGVLRLLFGVPHMRFGVALQGKSPGFRQSGPKRSTPNGKRSTPNGKPAAGSCLRWPMFSHEIRIPRRLPYAKSPHPPRGCGLAVATGGELGIRTPDTRCGVYSLSRRAPSASRSALRNSAAYDNARPSVHASKILPFHNPHALQELLREKRLVNHDIVRMGTHQLPRKHRGELRRAAGPRIGRNPGSRGQTAQ